jgi:hypothetical protein
MERSAYNGLLFSEATVVTDLSPACSSPPLDATPAQPSLSAANLTLLMKRFAAVAAAAAATTTSKEATLTTKAPAAADAVAANEEEGEEDMPGLLSSLEIFSFGRRNDAGGCYLYLAPATPPASEREECCASSASSYVGGFSPPGDMLSPPLEMLSPPGDMLSPPLSTAGPEMSPSSPASVGSGQANISSTSASDIGSSVAVVVTDVTAAPLTPDNLDLNTAIPEKPICSFDVLQDLNETMNLENNGNDVNRDDDDKRRDDVQSLVESAADDGCGDQLLTADESTAVHQFKSLNEREQNNDIKKQEYDNDDFTEDGNYQKHNTTIRGQSSSTQTIKYEPSISNRINNKSNDNVSNRIDNSSVCCWMNKFGKNNASLPVKQKNNGLNTFTRNTESSSNSSSTSCSNKRTSSALNKSCLGSSNSTKTSSMDYFRATPVSCASRRVPQKSARPSLGRHPF